MTGGVHYYTEKAAASCPSMLATPMYASLSPFYITKYKLDALQNLVSAGHTSKAQPKLDAILSGHVSAMALLLSIQSRSQRILSRKDIRANFIFKPIQDLLWLYIYIRLMLECGYAQTVLVLMKSHAIKSTVTRQST